MKSTVSFVRSECEDRSERAYPVLGIKRLVERARILMSSIMSSWVGFGSILVVMAVVLAYFAYRIAIMKGWVSNEKENMMRDRAKIMGGVGESGNKFVEGGIGGE